MDKASFQDIHAHVYPVLLAGGTGTRLWPVSRQLYPKQLVKFVGNDSLIQNTINRLKPIADPDHFRVVCGADHFHEIHRHLKDIGLDPEGKIIVEPCGRNTAPAVLLALFHVASFDPDAIICIFPADHVIADVLTFQEDVKAAALLARAGAIVTFGIRPRYPETGYGYIEGGDVLNGRGLTVKRFVEKPDRLTAEKYVKAGNFYWNSGMFAFTLRTMTEEFNAHAPALYRRMAAITDRHPVPDLADYMALPDISIDYAIMEHTKKAAVLPSDFGWSDIGSWKSLFDVMPKDAHNNVIVGDVVAQDTRDCFIMGQDRLIAVNRVKDLVVVDTPDSVFISDLENSRDVKDIVAILKKNKRKEFYQHLTVYHAWGKATLMHEDATCVVHGLTIFPGKACVVSPEGFFAHQFTVTAGAVVVVQTDTEVQLSRGETMALYKEDTPSIQNSLNIPVQMVAIRFVDAER